MINPAPESLPTLSIHCSAIKEHQTISISITYPEVPGLVFDAWSYENGGNDCLAVDLLAIRSLGGGKIELVHSARGYPGVVHITEVRPEKSAVEFIGRLERENGLQLPSDFELKYIHHRAPDMCCQMMRAPNFQSAPQETPRAQDKLPYLDFVKRCFIFTEEGQTFLIDTQRTGISAIFGYSQDDIRNNPPWVQQYYGVWQQVPRGEKGFAWACSPDRFIIPAIGCISNDGKYLAAMASDKPHFISQAWLDCFHIYAAWMPESVPQASRTWRRKLYAMKNDPQALLARLEKDFPEMKKLKDNRVPK